MKSFFKDYAQYVIGLMSITFFAGMTFAKLAYGSVEEIKKENKKQNDRIELCEKNSIGFKKDVQYTKETQIRILKELEKINDKLDKMNDGGKRK